MRVTFAPDWRHGVPYQRLLADHLARQGVQVDFLQNYRRILPLYRGLRDNGTDLVHLHWPEAYWPVRSDRLDLLRRWRYPFDIALASAEHPFIYSAHNLWPHNEPHCDSIRRTIQATLDSASAVIVHTHAALDELVTDFDLPPQRCTVIPHGDLSVELGPPPTRQEARRQLNLDDRRAALIFGRAEPYKGIEEIIAWWNREQPDIHLYLFGEPYNPDYGTTLQSLARGNPRIHIQLRRLDNQELARWLSAADVALFNYRHVLTSGAASLARSWGLPLLLPERHRTIELGEPTPYVVRFHTIHDDFGTALHRALTQKPDPAAAAAWRESISWPNIARQTAAVYQRILI